MVTFATAVKDGDTLMSMWCGTGVLCCLSCCLNCRAREVQLHSLLWAHPVRPLAVALLCVAGEAGTSWPKLLWGR